MVGVFAELGVGIIRLELFDERLALVGIVEHLDIQHGLHVNHLGDGVGLFAGVLGDELVKARQIRREVGGGVLAGLELGVDALDERLQARIHGIGGGAVGGGLGGEAGRREQGYGGEQCEKRFGVHKKFAFPDENIFWRAGQMFSGGQYFFKRA